MIPRSRGAEEVRRVRASGEVQALRATQDRARAPRVAGEDLDALSCDLRIEAHRIAGWREEFLAAGAAALKARAEARAPDRAALKDARAKVGELTMQVEILQELFQKGGSRYRRRRRGAPTG